MRKTPTVVHGYDRLASIYDPLATLYSGGTIGSCHRVVAERLERDERVLFVGVGGGRDAAAAARRGAIPTLLDLSPRMLRRARTRVRSEGIEPTSFLGDFRDLDPRHRYDAVVASFFLNVFRSDELPDLIKRLSTHVRPGGRLLLADFAPHHGGRLRRFGQRIYHDFPMFAFRAWTGNAVHPIHDLRAHLESGEWSEIVASPLRLFGVGPRWFEVLEARKR